ncbi:MAG: galactose-1-phosphate uridylyltransferase [Patescibacteria group bacterium]
MEEKRQDKNKISELRQDLVTGDWVVIATGRAKRAEDFSKSKREAIPESTDKPCFLCFPEETEQEKDVLMYNTASGDWSLRVFPNKFPAFKTDEKIDTFEEGPYFAMEGTGYHEIVDTRDHHRQIAQMNALEVAEIIDAYQDRYVDLMRKKNVNYIEIYHNHGREAGATANHPHSQIVAMPVVSPYVKAELDGAENYYRQNKECVYCSMISWEREKKTRIVFENEEFLVFCPFASRAAFETWVIPKKHSPYFERIGRESKLKLAEALQMAIAKIWKGLDDPAYNFYLHTSPADGKDYPHYHWHIEILPRTSIWAGFELSTGVEISTIEPEKAAEFLREN